MYDILKEQYASGKSLVLHKYFSVVRRDNWPKYIWDMHPLAQEYFHELNPFFLLNLYRPELYRFTKVVTARDGYLTFANFLMNNFGNFERYGMGLFLIHPDLVPLVPSHLAHHFGTWKLVQKKQVTIEQAKKIYVFAFVAEQYLGDLDQLPERMAVLKKAHPDAEIHLYLPIRKNVFETTSKESIATHIVMDAVKNVFPDRKLKIHTSDSFFELNDFKDSYLFDLACDNMYVSDNFIHYLAQSKGGTVNNGTLNSAPGDSIFSLDLSLYHELHICPLPKVQSMFNELLFYKKQNPSVREYVFDPNLQGLLRDLLRKNF